MGPTPEQPPPNVRTSSTSVTPPRRRGVRARIGDAVKAKVRYWVDGSEVLHWDDPRRRTQAAFPSFDSARILESRPGEGAPLRLGAYSGMHYTAVVLNGGEHHTDWVSVLHGLADEDGTWMAPRAHVASKGPVVVGSDVWVGYEALILSGITIGHGAVVAARAVVTKDVAPYSIVGGNPARHLKYRFDEPVREALLRICWWDWDRARVTAHADVIFSPEVERFVAEHDPALGPPSCDRCR